MFLGSPPSSAHSRPPTNADSGRAPGAKNSAMIRNGSRRVEFRSTVRASTLNISHRRGLQDISCVRCVSSSHSRQGSDRYPVTKPIRHPARFKFVSWSLRRPAWLENSAKKHPEYFEGRGRCRKLATGAYHCV